VIGHSENEVESADVSFSIVWDILVLSETDEFSLPNCPTKGRIRLRVKGELSFAEKDRSLFKSESYLSSQATRFGTRLMMKERGIVMASLIFFSWIAVAARA